VWAAHSPCEYPAIKAALFFPTTQCQWTSFTVWGVHASLVWLTLIRLGKCYPNSQHLLFDLLRERLSLSLRFPYFTKSNIFSNFVFRKIFKSKSTKEYKNCYPGPSGWTGNFLSRSLSFSLYVSVYVWRYTRVLMYGQACVHVSVYMHVYLCASGHACVHVYVHVCFCVSASVCIYGHVCVCVYIYVCPCVFCVCMYLCMCVCVCVWALHTQMSICECTYILAWAIWELIINGLHPSIL